MDQVVPTYEYPVYLEKWGVTLTVVVAPDGQYFILRELCAALGVRDVQQQAEQLQDRSAAAEFVKKLPVKTKGGRQRAWCLHQEILGGWLFMVNEKQLRAEFRSRLVEFQRDAYRALNRVLRGEVEGTVSSVDDGQSANITHLSDWLGRPRDPIQLPAPEDDAEE